MTPVKTGVVRLHRFGFAALAALFAVAAVVAIERRGPWYDEFYSFYMVRPGAPLAALWTAWLRDNHPPLFYALAWGWSRLVAPVGLANTVEGLRTINLAFCAVALIGLGLQARADRWFARLLWYDSLALASVFPAIDRMDQLRSYFLSFALTAVMLPSLARWIRGVARRDRRDVLGFGVVLALGLSVHLVTTVILAALVAATAAYLLLAGRRGDAGWLALIGAMAMAPFCASMALQVSTMLANTKAFWIPGGFDAARWAIESEVGNALTACPALTLAALVGMIGLVLAARRGDGDAREAWVLTATLGAGLGLGLAALIAVHLWRPLLITRYLVALDPIIALILALGAEAAARRLPVMLRSTLDMLLLLAAAWAVQANLAATLAETSWDGTGAAIAALLRTCPTTIVHADMRWNALPFARLQGDDQDIMPFSYRYVARRFGFPLAADAARNLSQRCPTLFWTEQVAALHPTAAQVLDHLRAQGYPVRSGRMERIGYGWIVITPPLSAG